MYQLRIDFENNVFLAYQLLYNYIQIKNFGSSIFFYYLFRSHLKAFSRNLTFLFLYLYFSTGSLPAITGASQQLS